MSDQAYQELRQVLAESDDPLAPWRALVAASRWAQQSEGMVRRADVFRMVGAFDDAIRVVIDLDSVVKRSLAIVELGPSLRELLASRQQDLTTLHAGIADLRQQVDDLEEVETTYREESALATGLEARHEELRRLQELIGRLPELQSERQRVEVEIVALARATENEEDLQQTADRFTRVGGSYLAWLTKSTQEAIFRANARRSDLERQTQQLAEQRREAQANLEYANAQCVAVETERARLQAEIDVARQRYEQVEALRDDQIAMLEAWRAADMEIVYVLKESGFGDEVRDVEQSLAQVGRLLQAVDRAIQQAVELRERQYRAEHEQRFFSG